MCVVDFERVCERSTDFHFPNLQQQIAVIEAELASVGERKPRLDDDAAPKIYTSKVGLQSWETQWTPNKFLTNLLFFHFIH